jgi:hypothetical protein
VYVPSDLLTAIEFDAFRVALLVVFLVHFSDLYEKRLEVATKVPSFVTQIITEAGGGSGN